jgi:mannose-6-phosphate isomerase-like protein (cupin superfamily)
MIENILHNNITIAIIICRNFSKSGITFFTPDDFSQQLAYMNHPKGKTIPPHVHNVVKREVLYTKEVLFIKRGRLRIDFYTDNREYVCSRELGSGDVILLAAGGHGFEILEDTEMFEVKQGPYAGENDKTRFEGIDKKDIKLTDGE